VAEWIKPVKNEIEEIQPAPFLLVPQCLNQLRHRVFPYAYYPFKIS
jgi:hypothetical protein